jgi:RNA-directed DNA polymerase
MPFSLNLLGQLSSFLGMPQDDIRHVASSMPKRYKIYAKPKVNGGRRIILHPCRELKALQYAVHEVLLNSFDVHPIAYAYIPGKKSPLRSSANEHASYSYTVRIDFKDFFPSIRPDDLITVIEHRYILSDVDKVLIREILFYKGKLNINGPPLLPIGAPTSPVVSNIVMGELDNKLASISKEIDQDSSITRYADDLYFSTNGKGVCRKFYQEVQGVLLETESPCLSINEQKTLFLSKGTKRVVNGLYVTPEGKVSIGRDRKTMVKSIIYRHSKGLLSNEELRQAKGVLAFIQDCEPEFYNRLAQKYGKFFYSIKDAKF